MTRQSMKLITFGLFLMVAFAAWAMPALATSFTYTLDTEFSGNQPAPGTLTAIIDDGGGTGSVTITMSYTGGGAGDKIGLWYFNFSGDSADLTFAFDDPASSGPAADSITQTTDCCKADGDGLYDIRFNFPTSGDVFGSGETVKYTVTLAGITANDFNVPSATAPGNGTTWCSAAHVQGLTTTAGSAFMGGACDGSTSTFDTPVPEPSTFILFGSGLLALVGVARRRRAQE